ncbi:MAG: 3-dehydroquinate synthase [Lachnospiraceae bacterium]|nr:3-dehydroquinate synthase [Lachnospiraceae bacterium]
MSRLTVKCGTKSSYDIIYKQSFEALPAEVSLLYPDKVRICVITDSNVDPLYSQEVTDKLESISSSVMKYVIPAGEEHKNLDEINKIYRFLIENKFDRKTLLVALGGGVVGDMTGYVAATFLRGVDFVQIPTTLLAQVDSSIGGKTGVDFEGFKNMIGAFKMPVLVYVNLSTLNSLPGRQFVSGFAEVMKSALLKDENFYVWLIDHSYEIRDMDLDTLSEMVYRCDDIKRMIVEKDPYEKKDRALLNLGHTLGHAIEKYYDFKFLHGECVALGCVAAAFISWKKEFLSKEEFYEIRDMFVLFGLPISMDLADTARIVELTKNDKKMASGHVKFILLKKIGKAFINEEVTDEEMSAALDELNFAEGD